MSKTTSSPERWLSHIKSCVRCSKVETTRWVTPWISGRLPPERKGWYERIFTDGVVRHYWSGSRWLSKPSGPQHWRQVGAYPAWRGLTSKGAAQ